jgi:hypothetical protein
MMPETDDATHDGKLLDNPVKQEQYRHTGSTQTGM